MKPAGARQRRGCSLEDGLPPNGAVNQLRPSASQRAQGSGRRMASMLEAVKPCLP